MTTITIATADDRDDVVRLFHGIDRHYYGDEAATPEATFRYVDANIGAPHCGVDVALARRAGRPVGVATWSILYPAPRLAGQLFMKDLFVVEEARGQGVGKALMQFLARVAVEAGCGRFDWTTETSNPGAMAWYDAMGAERVADKVYYRISGPGLAALSRETGP